MAMFMRALLIAGLFVVGSDAGFVGANQSFEGYVQAFGKNYAKSSTEYGMRENLFNARLAEILQHNARGLSWQMGLNDFTDWTDAELQMLRGFKRQHKGDTSLVGSSVLQLGSGDTSCVSKAQSCSNAQSCCGGLICGAHAVCEKPAELTEALDYSDIATAKEILNQGPCGSCWAVAAAAAVQLQAAKLHPGFKKVLSPESINKCAPNPMACGGDGGCQGSTPGLAFDYLKTQALSKGGLAAIDALPYTASTDSTGVPETDGDCASSTGSLSFLQIGNLRAPKIPVVGMSDWIKVKDNHAEQVMNSLATVGPLAVAIVGSGIQGYSSGVMSGCQSAVVDHAVLMMGYGKDPTSNMLYWNIRNSWGKSWGENGFFRLRRHYAPGADLTGDPMKGPESDPNTFQGEPCFDDEDPSKGVACKDASGNYPKKTRVCGECGIVSDVAYPTGITVDPNLLL